MAGKSRKRKANPEKVTERKRQKKEEFEGTQKDKKVCSSEQELQSIITSSLHVKLPGDFYEFWELCKEIRPDAPLDALADTLGLQLTGPYNIINGDLKDLELENKEDPSLCHMHSRYFYDPPEFMTVVKEKVYGTGFHMGYFRDVPHDLPLLIASNKAEVNSEFRNCGENIFYAVRCYAAEVMKQTKEKSAIADIKDLLTKIDNKAKENNHIMNLQTPSIKKRMKKTVTKSFHKIGIVVPVDDFEVGYRPLNLSDAALKNLLCKICESEDQDTKDKYFDELHDLVTLVQFANDECDYGMGLELGIDLFCFGNETFNNMILNLLTLAYSLLGRNLYGDIVKKHLKHRKKEKPIDLTVDRDFF